jgi:hypothetical protein
LEAKLTSLTEEQLENLFEIGEAFWKDFSKLCKDHIDMAVQRGIPIDYAELYLGEKTSIYGRMIDQTAVDISPSKSF